MKRIFAAVKIIPSEKLLDTLNLLQNKLLHDKIRWVDPKNIHVTLKFFGETPEGQIPAIIGALQKSAAASGKLSLKIRDSGIFGSRYQPKVIWLGIEDDGGLAHLHDSVANHLRIIGYGGDRQNFVPHLTLGRIKEIKDKVVFQAVISSIRNTFFQISPIGELLLYESILSSAGPDYHVLQCFPLGEPGGNVKT